MKNWPVQDAKNQLSRLIDLAQTEGPQAVTRHGHPVAVIVSANEFKKLSLPKESVLQFFSPLKASGIRLNRLGDVPRKLKL